MYLNKEQVFFLECGEFGHYSNYDLSSMRWEDRPPKSGYLFLFTLVQSQD